MATAINLQILSASGREIIKGGLQISEEVTIEELKKEFYKLKKKYYPFRQRFTLPPEKGEKRGIVLLDTNKLSDYNLKNKSIIIFKDLGPQIGYGTVFFWEYLGPLLIYPIFLLFPQLYIWNINNKIERHPIQFYALMYWTFHYSKRILETFFVHRFSHGTMPIRNLFKNCGYYWGFAAFISYFINHPYYMPPIYEQSVIFLILAFICQGGNYHCHMIQKNLRKPGDKAYKIPKGFLFNYVTCANYTFEIFGWLFFGFSTQCLAVFLFMLAGGLQMAQWADAKHRKLKKLFDGNDGREKYPKRWKMIPLIF